MPLIFWATHVLQWLIQCVLPTNVKLNLSSDSSLKFEMMKLESLVIVGQLYNGEYVLGPCTHRPSHPGSWVGPITFININVNGLFGD